MFLVLTLCKNIYILVMLTHVEFAKAKSSYGVVGVNRPSQKENFADKYLYVGV